jgi:F-type H+-transporting ATPase subunit epsilon
MSSIHLEIITPEKIAFTDEVEMVTVPSADGIIGVLPKHAPLFSRLIQGEVKILKKRDEIFLAIGGGFMEVTPEKVIILVTEAYHAEEINEQEMMMAKKRAEEALSQKPTGSALIEAKAMFQRSVIAMKIVGKRRRTTQREQHTVS